MTSEPTRSIAVPATLFRRLEALAVRHGSSIEAIVEHAIDLHYDDGIESMRWRLLDRLARLEAGLGDPARLQEQIAAEARRLRAQAPAHPGQARTQNQTQALTLTRPPTIPTD